MLVLPIWILDKSVSFIDFIGRESTQIPLCIPVGSPVPRILLTWSRIVEGGFVCITVVLIIDHTIIVGVGRTYSIGNGDLDGIKRFLEDIVSFPTYDIVPAVFLE